MRPAPTRRSTTPARPTCISFSEAIAAETAGEGVRVSALAPGPVNTRFHARMGSEHALLPLSRCPRLRRTAWPRAGYSRLRAGACASSCRASSIPFLALAMRILPHRIVIPIVGVVAEAARRQRERCSRPNPPIASDERRRHALPRRAAHPRRGEEARLHRAAPGALQSGPRRPVVPPQRLRARHPQAALRRSAARDARAALRRRHLRRPDERQRQGRVHLPGDRVDRRRAEGGEAVSRHLPRRADAGQPSRRQGRLPPRGAGRDRLLPARPRPRMGIASGPSPSTSTSGIARASSWPAARGCLPHPPAPTPTRPSPTARPSACSSTPRSPTPRCTAGPATTTRACGMKGARERHEHIEGHIDHAPKVHAWLDRFLAAGSSAELTID